MHVPRREMSQVLGFEVEEVENGAVDVSQVIAKCVTGMGCSLLAVTGRSLVVRATPSTLTDSLVAAAKRSGRLPITRGHFRFDEKAAVVIRENDLTRLHFDQPVGQKSVQQVLQIEAFVFGENA